MKTESSILHRPSVRLTAVAAFMASAGFAMASSHSDAPLIKLDPQANLTDVYAFIRTRPTGERALVVEVLVHPFSEPGDGVMYEAFSSDALYSIHITDPNTGAEVQRFDFQFSPVGAVGGRPPHDDYPMVAGIYYLLRVGGPWRDLPPCFGPWNSVYTRWRGCITIIL